MACNLTVGFLNDCKNSAGGITEIYVAPFSAKGNLQHASGSLIGTSTILASGSGAQFFKYNLRKATSEVKENIKVSEQNGTVYFEPECDIILTKSEVLKRNEISVLAQQSVMIVYKDNTNFTGSYWLVGSDSGLELSGGQQSGKAFGDLNGYTLKFGPGMEKYQQLSVASASINAFLTPA